MSQITNTKVAYGKSQGLIDIFNAPIVSLRSPTTNDKGSIGQLWVNKTTNQVWMLTSFLGGLAIWSELDNSGSVGGLNWIVTAAPAINMAVNTGYILTNGGTVTLTLPLVAVEGTQMNIMGNNSSWIIAQNAGQLIAFRDNVTTNGVGGHMDSIVGHLDVNVQLLTTDADTAFSVQLANDNLLLV